MAEGRHAPQSRRIKPAYLIAGGVGALALLVGLLVVLTGGSDSPLIPGHSEAPTPTFTFQVTKTVPVTTVLLQPDGSPPDAKKSAEAAKPAAANTQKTLHALYSDAFLVPGNWTNDSYDDAFDSFSEEAQAQAMEQIDILTAGSTAGETYSDIQPAKATMKTKVLLDPEGPAVLGGEHGDVHGGCHLKDGSGTMTLISKGQYVFEKTSDGWQITAFSVQRTDQAPKSTGSSFRVGRRLRVGVRMRRRALLVVLGLIAWVMGSALGALGPVTAHAQSAGMAVGKAHAGYTPVPHGVQAHRGPCSGQRRPPRRRRPALARGLDPPDLHQPRQAPRHHGGDPARLLREHPGPRHGQDQLVAVLRRPGVARADGRGACPASASTTGPSPRSGASRT